MLQFETKEDKIYVIKTGSQYEVNIVTEEVVAQAVTSEVVLFPVVVGTSSTVSIVAQEDIAKYDVVTADGFKANSNTIAHRGKVLGLATEDILTGFSGEVQVGGELDNALWAWVAGDKVFLNGTTLSTIVPSVGFIIRIATANKTDTLSIEVQPSILL